MAQSSLYKHLARHLPILEVLRRYDGDTLKGDASAGLTTAVMLIPQGMAYALLAGLPPIIGLYASTVPLLLYAIFGTSRQLAVGPVAMASLLVASGVAQMPGAESFTSSQYVQAAISLTLIAGACQVLMGIFRLGFLVNLLSHPVVSGFTGAAAIIIGSSQLQHLMGLSIPRELATHQTLLYAAQHAPSLHGPTLAFGLGAIALIVALKRWAPRVPAALSAVALGILLSWLLEMPAAAGVDVLGEIPGGLPSVSWPEGLSLEVTERLLPMGLTIALISFMESISAAKIYARQNRYEIDANQELVGLGAANLGAALFGGYAVGGALSRTAVNADAGAKSPVAGVVTACAVGVTLLFLTPLFYHLPKAVLAGIIMVAVTGLIDIEEFEYLWKVKRDDLALLLVTFTATLVIGIELGILIGVGSSLLWLVFTTTRPHIAQLGRLPGTRSYRSTRHFSDAETFDRVLILRMDAQFFFGNVAFLKKTLREAIAQREQTEAVVLDASSINALDSTAVEAFREIIEELREQDIDVFISHVKGPVLEVMEAADLVLALGPGHLFYEVEDAVSAARRWCRSDGRVDLTSDPLD